eukprot:TRINITY_DN1887_c0_g2_i1.p2 TRINITY_DN1887_c0_g2~~TRINITY_DN1887_c0_g2_i1.p2  ORF type:complete len:705 (+),score=242.91 TRINITY_DN1887_c0_g2_i1:96-2210(+)
MYADKERLFELIEDKLADDGEDDLMDFVSDDEGEDYNAIEPPVTLDQTFPTTLFISGLPKVGKEKYDKLMGVLGKLIDKYGPNKKVMPLNKDTNQTEGFLIVEYEEKADADKGAQTLDGMSLDRNHTFKVTMMDEFDKIIGRPDKFTPKKSINAFSRTDFRDWQLDAKFREQLLLRYQSETEIYWHDTLAGMPMLCYGGEREKRTGKIWCDWYVQWSPGGSYLVTMHKPGIALWAGPNFEKKARIAHDSVKFVQFSPSEEFVLTWNGSDPRDGDEQAIRIHRVLTGECMKKCRTPTMTPGGGDTPHFLWSADSKYYAECSENTISVRDTVSFELLKDSEGKKKILKYEALHTFSWSPRDNIIAVWTLEKNNNPARLVLIEIPSRRELASRSRTQVEASIHWQSEGDYLCLLTTKISKAGKKGATNLEIFRIREKNIPVEVVEVKDTVRGFFWETKGSRFGVLTTDEGGLTPKLWMYHLAKEKIILLSETNLPSNGYDKIFWAPDGQYFVCAAVGNALSSNLLFGCLSADNKLEFLHQDEHFMLSDVQWSPCSRYVLTAVTQPMRSDNFRNIMEAGYALWTFQGRKLFWQQKEKLFQAAWRPHGQPLLGEDQQAHIRKNIKQFSKRYDALDDKAKESARNAFKQERDAKMNSFEDILDRLEDFKCDHFEELGWDEAWEQLYESQRWEMEEQLLEEELGIQEELIS